jgi:prepilin-type N-terminal cleavage/methylation domain-containing protein
MERSGFSLTELLIVVAIIALLAALLFPVFRAARTSAAGTPCLTNLRQLHVGWAAYMQDSNDVMPPSITQFAGAAVNHPILKCPLDPTPNGENETISARLSTPVSYYYVRNTPEFRQALLEADPNHGILYCLMHGPRKTVTGRNFSAQTDTSGTVFRLRRDGSIQQVPVAPLCSASTSSGRMEGRQHWSLLSDVKCVDPHCDGLTEPCN